MTGSLALRDLLETVGGAIVLTGRFLAEDPNQLGGQLCFRIDGDDDPRLNDLNDVASAPSSSERLRPLHCGAGASSGGGAVALSGHTNAVTSVAVSPDGRALVTGSWDRTVRVWDLDTGRLTHRFEGHDEYVEAVAVTPDGRRAVSGSVDGTVRIWDLAAGCSERVIDVEDPVVDVDIDPAGRRVAVAGSARVALWNLDTGDRTVTVLDERRPDDDPAQLQRDLGIFGRDFLVARKRSDDVLCVAAEPAGGRLFVGRVDGRVEWWDLVDGSSGLLGAHPGPVWCLAVSPDTTSVVSGGEDGTARVWDVRAGGLRFVLEGHTAPVRAVAVSPEGTRVITGSNDRTVRVWDATTGTAVGTLAGHGSWVLALAVQGDGTRILSGSDDRLVRIWDYPDAPDDTHADAEIVLAGHSEGVMAVAAVSGQSDRLVSASQDHTVKVWDLSDGSVLHDLRGHSAEVLGVAVLPDGGLMVSAGGTTLRCWDVATGDLLWTVPAHRGAAMCVAVAADGRRMLSGGADGIVVLWDLATRSRLAEFEASSPVLGVAFSADGRRGVAGTNDGSVLVVDLETGAVVDSATRHRGFVRSVAILGDGRIVSGGGDGLTSVWEPGTGTVDAALDAGHGPVGAVLVVDDATVLVSHVDGTVVTWDLHRGETTGTIRAHVEPVGAMALLPDGRLATGSGDRTIRVAPVGGDDWPPAPHHVGPVTGLAVGDDAARVYSSSLDRTIRRWDVKGDSVGAVLCGTPAPARSMALSSDADMLVVSCDDGNIVGWDLVRGELSDMFDVGRTALTVTVAADGRHVVFGAPSDVSVVSLEDQRVVWDLEPGAVAVAVARDRVFALDRDASVRVIDLHTGLVRATLVADGERDGLLWTGPIAVDPTGSVAASVAVQRNDLGVHDNPIRIWDLETGRSTGILRGHTDWVRALAFTGTGLLVSAGQDTTVRVWDLADGSQRAWFGTGDLLAAVAVSSDGQVVAAGGTSGAVYLFRYGQGI